MRELALAGGAIGVILLSAFVGVRLVRARRAGLSIRLQVFLALATIVGAFALGLGLLVVDRIEARTTLLAENAARDEAAAVASFVGSELESRGTGLAELARTLRAAKGGSPLGFELLAPDGVVLFASARSDVTENERAVAAVEPIVRAGVVVGSVRVVKPTIVVQRVLADFAPTILVLSTVLGAAAGVASALIGRAIAKPIEALTEFASRVSGGDLRAARPPAQGREVRLLSQAIDSMRRELEGRPFVETFAADLSHELKNPVAAIRASAEVLADGALEDPEAARKFLGRILESTARIEALLGDLLSLARLEARGLDEAERVDLVQIARDVVKASEGRGELQLTGADEAWVRGDPEWLRRALDNLVENALVHGVGKRVAVDVTKVDGVELRVRNAGRVEKHVSKQLFRRFVTTRRDRGGTGLGLAIVRAIAEAHQGTIECEASGPPEVVLAVRLPEA